MPERAHPAAQNRKPIKQEAKAKEKPNIKKVPNLASISHASVVDVLEVDRAASWFVRVGLNASKYASPNEDQRCPTWSEVKAQRTIAMDIWVLLGRERYPWARRFKG